MENIITKAIEGGYDHLTVSQMEAFQAGTLLREFYILDPLFWQSLGKACGWTEHARCPTCGRVMPRAGFRETIEEWKYHALRFHEINLTENWDQAVEYLTKLIKE